MPNDTATLVLNGTISLRDHVAATQGFLALMDALATDVASGAEIDWEVTGLEGGSTHTTIKGTPKSGWNPAGVDRVVSAYQEVGAAMRDGKPIPYSVAVRDAAYRIKSVLKGHVRSVVFETEADDVEVISAEVVVPQREIRLAQVCHGAIRGRVQSLSNRNQLRFTLYDLVHDRAVSCYLKPGSEDKMRVAWGRLAIVEGIVRRDPFTGQPTTIRDIQDIHIVAEPTGTWRDAKGIAPARPGSISSEEAVRKVRDG
jgi:hypothetical protein